ncbi:Hsp70 nucleotide exchange factor FES1 [Smittium culicis]|uniref:Hsp70 nucleotide exchange factor FES1 n=1 Tax=Smittium culicis TaxID=133412 RepID=A0A1R1Y799_9FUNG|nr:Hsp70 nucleotide exchange factor FES1 [Smittium culicis]OMJ27635.1 Hsp70 nucleotide exchange factor FES1 [Smittium culicis]
MDKLLQWSIVNTKADAPVDKKKLEQLDPEIIDMILGKPMSTQMLEIMDIIESPVVSIEDKEVEFDNLEMIVEQIDNAANIEPLGMWPRLLAQLHLPISPDQDDLDVLRVGALWQPRRAALAPRCAALARERGRPHQGRLCSLVVHAVEPARVQRARERRRARPAGRAGRRQQRRRWRAIERAREEGGVPAACAGFGKPG